MNSEYLTEQYGYYWEMLNYLFEDYAKKHGLNYTQLSVLYTIYRQPGCTQKTICERNFLPKQTVNTAIQEYVNEGLVTFVTDEKDKRQKKLYLSEEGRKYADSFLPRLASSRYEAMECLDEEEQQTLVELTEKYILKVQEMINKEES